jgi:HTH-type transcriptional regulator/antitoxin HigA
MGEGKGFNPDWCISPGETLRDWMDENGLSARVTAKACSLDVVVFQRILDGKQRIGLTKACKLQQGTGIPAQLWLNLERAYRQGLAEGKYVVSSLPPDREGGS